MLARAALAAVLVPLGIVCWVSVSEIRRCHTPFCSASQKKAKLSY